MTADEKSFWYRVDDGTVEEGPKSPGDRRMGPYATPEAAQNALQSAAQRTQAWDEEDRRTDDD